MSASAPKHTTGDEQSEGNRYELVATLQENAAHASTKIRVAEAIEAGDIACKAFCDGMAVRADAGTIP